LTVSGPTISLDFVSIIGNGLTQNGTIISIDNNAFGTPVYQRNTLIFPILNTTGDFSPTGITFSNTPSEYSRVQVFVNGQLQNLGNGTFSNVDCYFSNDSGNTSLSLSNLSDGDEFYWNGTQSGFNLDTTDKIDIIYES
jgi:hypothetical protein